MASIDVYDIGSTSFSVRLIDLQTVVEGADYTRQCMWSVYENPNADGTGGTLVDTGISYIEPITSTTDRSGGNYYFSNMTPNTTYRVLCYVYNMVNNTLVATLKSENFKTASSGGSGGGESGDDTPWALAKISYGNISSYMHYPISVKANTLYRFQVSFASSGSVKIYTTGSLDTMGYLTTSEDVDLTYGCPDYYESKNMDDDSGDGYNFSLNPYISAGTTYYIWVRAAYEDFSGTTQLHIERTWSVSLQNALTLSGEREYTLTLKPFTAYRRPLKFDTAGMATFYTTDATVKICGYYTKTTDFDYENGVPKNITVSSNQNSLDFSMSTEVTANDSSSNYLFVRAVNGTDAGTVTVHIVPPKDASIDKWDWYSSNGTASANQTIAAYNAVANKQSTKNFSHLVWNDMVDKVKAISDKAVGWWDSASYGLSAENTKAIANSDGEYELSAKMFNTLRNNLEIAGIEVGLSKISDSSIPHPVYSGEKVFGHYFTTLTDYMNSVIDKL